MDQAPLIQPLGLCSKKQVVLARVCCCASASAELQNSPRDIISEVVADLFGWLQQSVNPSTWGGVLPWHLQHTGLVHGLCWEHELTHWHAAQHRLMSMRDSLLSVSPLGKQLA